MPARIYPKRKPRIYLQEWREHLRLTQQQLADRLETSDATIARWENGKRRPDLNALAAVSEALGIPLSAMFRHPDTPSADDILADQKPDVVEKAIKVLRAMRA